MIWMFKKADRFHVMGNIHHLQHLGQGAGDWNAWRQQEPDVRPDLTSANLRGTNLAGMDLSRSLLSLANLGKAVLSGANLRDCNLPRASLEDADLSGAKLQGANLAGATLLRANFSGANLRMANLAGANLAGKMDLSGVDLTGANLAGAKLMGANFSGATLTGANLAGADARNANFTGADLTDAVTAGTLLDGANMSGAVIRRSASRTQAPGAVPEPEAPKSYDEAEAEADLLPVLPDKAPASTDRAPSPEQIELPPSDLDPGLDAEEAWDDKTPDEPETSPAIEAGVEFGDELEQPEPPMSLSDEDMAGGVAELTDSGPVALPVPAQLAESEIYDLLATTELEAPPTPPPSQGNEILDDEADSPFYTYETRDLAILALYSDQVSRKTKAEKAMLLDLLVQYNRNFLGQDISVPMTTSGNAILVGFGDPTNALRCGGLYISMLRDMHVDSYVAVNSSMATVRVDPEGTESDELIANSISPSARLMPVGVVGEVLVLEELYSNPQTQRDLFTFERVARKWKATNDTQSEGIDVICYSVRSKQPPRP